MIYVGKIRPDTTRTELRDRFEVFGEIEECTVNLRDDGYELSRLFLVWKLPYVKNYGGKITGMGVTSVSAVTDDMLSSKPYLFSFILIY